MIKGTKSKYDWQAYVICEVHKDIKGPKMQKIAGKQHSETEYVM